MRNGLLQPAIATAVTANLTSLQDTLSNLERICNTPLPFAYQAHLRLSLWLYLFFLPVCGTFSFKGLQSHARMVSSKFTLNSSGSLSPELRSLPSCSSDSLKSVKKCKCLHIFGGPTLTTVNSENPFNYDLNDLDLDYFCQVVQRELHLITAVRLFLLSVESNCSLSTVVHEPRPP